MYTKRRDERQEASVSEPVTTPTMQEALDNAVRLLQAAEMETNLPLGEHLVGVADGWISVAAVLADHESTT